MNSDRPVRITAALAAALGTLAAAGCSATAATRVAARASFIHELGTHPYVVAMERSDGDRERGDVLLVARLGAGQGVAGTPSIVRVNAAGLRASEAAFHRKAAPSHWIITVNRKGAVLDWTAASTTSRILAESPAEGGGQLEGRVVAVGDPVVFGRVPYRPGTTIELWRADGANPVRVAAVPAPRGGIRPRTLAPARQP